MLSPLLHRGGRGPWWGLLAGVLIWAVGAPSLSGQSRLTKIELGDITVLSDARERDVRRFTASYAAYRRVFHEYLQAEGRPLPPVRVALFNLPRDFERVIGHDSRGSGLARATTFTGELDEAVVFGLALEGDPVRALRLIIEFDTMRAFRRQRSGLPLWVVQGAGQVLSDIEWSGGQMHLGRANRALASDARARAWLPWERFFEVNSRSPEYQPGQRDFVYHAQAWALMHYILLGDGEVRMRERFEALQRALGDEESGLAAVEALLGWDAQALTRELNRYVGRRLPHLAVPFDETAELAAAATTPAPAAEWEVLLADLAYVARQEGPLRHHLERAEAADPEAVKVIEARARRVWDEHRFDEAVALYRRAIALGTNNPLSYLRSGRGWLVEAGVDSSLVPDSVGEPARRAKVELERALELQPDLDPAWLLLGRVLIIHHDTEPSEVTRLDAILDRPRGMHSDEWRYLRALLRQRFGDVAGYREDLRAMVLGPRTLPGRRTMAREALLRSALNDTVLRVNELALAGQGDAAQAELDAARAALAGISDADPRGLLVLVQAWLDHRLAWNNLLHLRERGQWDALLQAIAAFEENFPHSEALPRAIELRQEAQAARR